MRRILLPIAAVFTLVFLQGSSSIDKNYRQQTPVSYAKDVAPIIQNSCTPCHFPPDGRKEALNTYEAMKENIDGVLKRIKLPHDDRKFMPKGKDALIVSDSLIVVLENWQKQNMPQ